MNIRYELIKTAAAIPFKCGRCWRDKTSKTQVTRIKDGVTDVICNGCYGEARAKESGRIL